MSAISSDILVITADPRGLGGAPGVLTVETVISDSITVDEIAKRNAAGVTIDDAILDTSIGGDQLGVADGIATLDSNGKIPVNQIPDVVAGGLDAKGSCRAKTVAALPAYTAAGSQVGKTITADANGAIPAVDGVTLVAADRVLVDQNGAASNVDCGIYVVTQVGDGSNPWILTRSTDADENDEISAGTYTFIEEGSTAAANAFVVDTPNPIVVDTTAMTWTIFSSSLVGVTTGDNTTVGQNTLTAITSGTKNSGVGIQTLNVLTEGDNNSTLGHQTLLTITTGNNNIAVGYQAMSAAAGAASNQTALGYQALQNVTTGTFNTATGYQTLNTVTTGARNTASGYRALQDLLGSSDNTATGYLAGTNITGGASNTAIGSYALTTTHNGSSNTAVGKDALQLNNSGASNTAIGARALEGQGSNYSTAVGFEALVQASALNNTAVGKRAGDGITSGAGNTLIGADTETSAPNAIDRIAIGRAAVTGTDFSAQWRANALDG